jgi:hypothetical protein
MSNRPISIVFVHQGSAEHLRYALRAAADSNPQADVFLLGDETNRDFPCTKHYNSADFFASAAEFGRYYQHFSANTVAFELFCFQRWFILRDFSRALGLEKIFYLDSDVLLFADLAAEWPKFSASTFTLSEGSCGHNSFWNGVAPLDDFCRFVIDAYRQPENAAACEIFNFGKEYLRRYQAGGVCDMTLFRFYKQRHPGIVGETAGIINGATYDDNLSSAVQQGIRYQTSPFGIKRIYWRGRLPYGRTSQEETVCFHTLHVQGDKKRYIGRIYKRETVLAWRAYLRNQCLSVLARFRLLKVLLAIKRAGRIFKK